MRVGWAAVGRCWVASGGPSSTSVMGWPEESRSGGRRKKRKKREGREEMRGEKKEERERERERERDRERESGEEKERGRRWGNGFSGLSGFET